MTEDVDPENPRPAGHYGRFRDAPWYYVSDDLASTVMLGPATDADPGLEATVRIARTMLENMDTGEDAAADPDSRE